MNSPIPFIIIDDDEGDNYIAKRIIKKLLPQAEIIIFTDAAKGLEYIKAGYAKSEAETILFLDINMPEMTGWEFIEGFEKLEDKARQLVTIYLLTASDADIDKVRAKHDKNITDYIIKPLTENTLLPVIFNRIKKNLPNEESIQ